MTSPSQTQTPVSLLSDKKYAIVVQLATLILPALQAFYFGLGELWGLPYVAQITGTIALLNVLLGALAGISKKLYDVSGAKYVGVVNVSQNADGKTLYELDAGENLDQIASMSEISFKVHRI